MRIIDAAYVDAALVATAPRRGTLYGRYAFGLAAIAGVLTLAFLGPKAGIPSILTAAAPLLMLALMLSMGWISGRRQQKTRRMLLSAWEAMQLERWDNAAALVDRLTHQPIWSETDRAQAFLLLASLAEHEQRFEAAAYVYETILDENLGETGQQFQARIGLAAAQVRCEHLTDAVDLLSRLERVPLPPALSSASDLVRLFQQVFMGQNEDAVAALDERRSLFRRHLSTRAGVGYGLLATAMHALGRREEAEGLWRDATTLIRSEKLVAEYSLLGPVAAAYPVTEWPI